MLSVWPHVDLIQKKEIEQAAPSSVKPHVANLILQKEIEQATPSSAGPQADLILQKEIKQATPSGLAPRKPHFNTAKYNGDTMPTPFETTILI
jgi:hypothetical protein